MTFFTRIIPGGKINKYTCSKMETRKILEIFLIRLGEKTHHTLEPRMFVAFLVKCSALVSQKRGNILPLFYDICLVIFAAKYSVQIKITMDNIILGKTNLLNEKNQVS